ncbi:MAG: 5'/3'-nucleotidase SurE [Anaerolineae bacterium]|nr:5'/3'-nucleotidase SurE [Anaerolineae bacterium]
MNTKRPHILITNDDGIESPGILALATVLEPLADLTIVAPREQSSAAGRSLFLWADGKISRRSLLVNGRPHDAFAVGGSPAQSVLHGLLEVTPARRPDLVVSGINYGENMGTSITLSGTVGAALEAASMGIPAIAVSLQLCEDLWLTHDQSVDFSGAAYFAALFAGWMLAHQLPADLDLIKIDVPSGATSETPWRLTRLARHRYWDPLVRREDGWDSQARIDGGVTVTPDQFAGDTDIRTLFDGEVTVTPLSIDMSSRIDLSALEKEIRTK